MPDSNLSLEDVQSVLPGGPNLALPSLTPAKHAAPAGLSLSDVSEVMPESKPAGLQLSDVSEVVPPAPGQPRVYTVQDVKNTPEADLDKDKEFSPVQFATANQDALTHDPELLDKVTRLYQGRETRGTSIAEKAKALVQGTPEVAKTIGHGIKEAATKAFELNPVAIAARLAGAASTNVPNAADQELKKIAGEEATIPASIESATTNSSDLLRRGGRAVKEAVGKVIPGVSSKGELTADEWKSRLFSDVAGLEQAQKAGQGNGAVADALGTSATELKQSGIDIDPKAIQDLSVVTDPVNYIPLAGAVGAVGKFGGKLGTKIIARVLTAEQAARAAEVLNKATELASTGKDLAGAGAGKALQATGGAVEGLGQGLQNFINSGLGSLGTGVGAGAAVATHGIPSVAAGIAGIKIAGPAIKKIGQGITTAGEIASGIRPVPGAVSALGRAAVEGAKGVGEGLLVGVPFELGARPEEEQGVLGGAGLAGAVRAGAHVTGVGARAVGQIAQDKLAEKIFKEVDQKPSPESATYGTDPALDTAHASTVQTLDPRAQKLVNWTRELFRDSGVEVYALPEDQFAKETGHDSAHGFKTDIGETVDANGNAKPLVRILLNSSGEAVPHEIFHALASVDPEGSRELIDAVKKSWTPEQQKQFSDIYNSALNGGKPERLWTKRLNPEQLAEEAAAEVFSRSYLAQDLSGVDTPIRQKAATFLSQILEKVGAPLGKVGAKAGTPGVSTLGVRPSAEQAGAAQGYLSNVLKRLSESGTTVEPGPSKLINNVRPEDISPGHITRQQPQSAPAPAAPAPVPSALKPTAPPAPVPAGPPPVAPRPVGQRPVPGPAPKPATPAPRNIRVTKEQQDAFAKRSQDLGVDKARAAATKQTPEVQARVEEITGHMENGNPVLEIEHSGVKTPSSSEKPNGRTARRAEQEAAYIAENAGAAPKSIRESYGKTFVPDRWETAGGKAQLIAFSLDKVIANISRLTEDTLAHGAEDLLPYDADKGHLTEAGWNQIVEDVQNYTANQSNGYRGDGQKLNRPTSDIGVSLPAENPGYSPVQIPEERANFVNAVMGLNPPLTAREVRGAGVPGNVKGQIIAEANARIPQTPAVIGPEHVQKQTFSSGKTVKETNPLRNELAARGVPVRELIEVTERLNAEDISKVTPRPDINFKAPVTDTIRGGFLPKAGQSVENFGKELADLNPEDWRTRTKEMHGGLTGGAWELGNSLTDRADLDHLRQFQSEQKKIASDAIASDDFDTASIAASKSQFFREAIEAATDTGSAKKARESGRLTAPPSFPETSGSFLPGREPSAIEKEVSKRLEERRKLGNPITDVMKKRVQMEVEKDQREGRLGADQNEKAGFLLPKTAKGKELLDKEGIDFRIAGPANHRSVSLYKDGTSIGEVISVERSPGVASIDLAQLKKDFRGKGAGEAAYRELLTQLKADGIKEVTGMFVAPEPIAIRKKIFGGFDSLELNGEPITVEEALKEATRLDNKTGRKSPDLISIEGSNKITEDSQFLPKPKIDKKFVEKRLKKILGDSPEVSEHTREYLTKKIRSDLEREARQAVALSKRSNLPSVESIEPVKSSLESHPSTDTKSPEKIVAAAWKDAEGKVHTGPFHAQIYDDLGLGPLAGQDNFNIQAGEGFVTSKGRFVFREEAARIAKDQGQVPKNSDTQLDAEELDFFLPKLELPKEDPLGQEKGWLSPEGKFYSLKSIGKPQATHNDLAEKITGLKGGYPEAMNALQDAGWMRFTPIGTTSVVVENFSRKPLTTAQRRALTDWAIEDKHLATLEYDNGHSRPEILHSNDAALDGNYLPKQVTPEKQKTRNKQAAEYQKWARTQPEAIVPEISRDENGNVKLDSNGALIWKKEPYRFDETPIATAASKGIKDPKERHEAMVSALGSKLEGQAEGALKNPEIKAGLNWYTLARQKIGKLLGDDAGFFTELLGATSAQTPVPDNFKQSVEAYNKFKAGDYDEILAKYREGKQRWADGEIQDYLEANPGEEPERHQFLNWWVEKNKLKPRKENGQLYNANSKQVLKVFDGSWKEEVGGPKTPNFADNLSGKSDEATIDVWAARALMAAGNEGNTKRWRLTNASESGVTDKQFFFAQDVFRRAAEKLGIAPHELQALLWFNEKHRWAENGWTSKVGEEKSDFNTLLDQTERTPEGRLGLKSNPEPKTELDMGPSASDIKEKAKQ